MERLRGALAGFLSGLVFAVLVGIIGFVVSFVSGMLATTGNQFLASSFEVVVTVSIVAPLATVPLFTFFGWAFKWHIFSFGRAT